MKFAMKRHNKLDNLCIFTFNYDFHFTLLYILLIKLKIKETNIFKNNKTQLLSFYFSLQLHKNYINNEIKELVTLIISRKRKIMIINESKNIEI